MTPRPSASARNSARVGLAIPRKLRGRRAGQQRAQSLSQRAVDSHPTNPFFWATHSLSNVRQLYTSRPSLTKKALAGGKVPSSQSVGGRRRRLRNGNASLPS